MAYKPIILGVLNVSPESRIKKSVAVSRKSILEKARFLKKNGSEFIDIGARSATNRKIKVNEKIEQERLIPAIKLLKGKGYKISIDTWNSNTAIKCLKAGADMINFTSSAFTDKLLKAVKKHDAWIVSTYMPYKNVYMMDKFRFRAYDFKNIIDYFKSKKKQAAKYKIKKMILDPNVGIIHPSLQTYGKIMLQVNVLSNLGKFKKLGKVMISVPRKKSPDDTAMMAALAIINKADFIRTHDPEIIREIL